MSDLSQYLPIDRRAALMSGGDLPERVSGAVMFADITGFTPLAEALVRSLGPRRGSEEITALLNRVYTALLAQVDRFGGSVIGFSGDAVTCWFDEQGAGGEPARAGAALRAIAAGHAMQRVMAELTPESATQLMVKVAVSAGPARRFLIGDPHVQLIEVLAGRTLERVAAAAHLAERDDVVVDPLTLAQIEPPLHVSAWRGKHPAELRAAVIAGLPLEVPACPWPSTALGQLPGEQARAWVPPAIYARVRHGADPLLAELRPAVALMLQFDAIDYDQDEAAGAKLDAYIRQVQAIVTRYDGHLVDLTMADKGGYLFAAFGALQAHEDDARRAALAALELRALRVAPENPAPRIGISQGTMRTGPYGGATRRTYGVLGDEVNLACRLMSAAAPGQILASARLHQALGGSIQSVEQAAIRVKGKRERVAIYEIVAEAPASHPAWALGVANTPLIGRAAEYGALRAALEAAVIGTSSVAVVEGEAGIGKSRLIAELLGRAREQGLAGLVGVGQSVEHAPYGAWRAIFNAYFGLSPATPADERGARVQAQVASLAPALVEQLPLLAELLQLGMPETDSTRALETSQRAEALAELLAELLRARAMQQPLIVVLDDAQLLDMRSLSLVLRVAQACAPSGEQPEHAGPRLLLILALRSLDASNPTMAQITQLLGVRRARWVRLAGLAPHEVVALAAARLGVEPAELPAAVGELVCARAGGNPLFAEELIATLRDQGAIRVELAARTRRVVSGDLGQLLLPDTLRGLMLGRIDRLPPAERLTLRIASAIGSAFDFVVLHYLRNRQAAIGKAELMNQLRALAAQDFIWLESPAPQLAYRFKHVLTQEAAYDSLLYAQRRDLHRLLAGWYEQTFGNADLSYSLFQNAEPKATTSKLVPYIPLLAYHYRLAEDDEREQFYVGLLGEQALHAGAFHEAITSFERAVALTPPGNFGQRGRLAALQGRAALLLGNAGQAEQHYRASLALAAAAGDQAGEAWANLELGVLAYRRKEYPAARQQLERCLALYRALADRRGELRALDRLGAILIELGDEAQALAHYQRALALGQAERRRSG